MMGACSPTQTGPVGAIMPATTGTITSVVDGDSLDVTTAEGSLTVRLADVNAPERGECYADEARSHLAGEEGSAATVEVVGTDQFDRALAYLSVGDRRLNLEMVTLGLAIALTPDPGETRGADILTAEQRAYDGGVGLWGPMACGDRGPEADVVIDIGRSEPNPDGPDDEHLQDEYIVVANVGSAAIDLSGWILRDESSRNRYRFPSGSLIRAGEHVAVTSSDPGWSPGGGPVWNNDGDMALLQDDLGTVVDRWRY